MVSVVVLQIAAVFSHVRAQGTEVVIYLDSTRQAISGFGAANIRPWRPDMTAGDIQKAFGTGPGQLGFTILRLRVPYQTSEFGLNVPTAQSAHSMGVKIIASPWTPPAWMKTSNDIVGGSLYDTSYASYALHLKSFADYMANNGVPLYAISVQNEPDVQVTYESCDWDAPQMLKFVKENAQAVGTRIIVPESFNFNPAISDAILNDTTAASHVPIIGGHIYGGGLASYPLAAGKGKELWMTEHLVLDTSWSAVLATGKEIHDCLSAGMNAYIWWYIVRYYGPIGEDGNVTKRGYVMSQFSRFIRPGSHRIYATRPAGSVFVTAYKGNSRVVIVAVNTGSSSIEQTMRIENLAGAIETVAPYVTSQAKNCAQGNDIAVSNGSFTAILEGMSVSTFVGDIVSGEIDAPTRPRTFVLAQNHPNPFNPVTVIRFDLPVTSRVSLTVYDLLGRQMTSLVDGILDPGYHKTEWNAHAAASGLYLYRLEVSALEDPANAFVETRKMLLVR